MSLETWWLQGFFSRQEHGARLVSGWATGPCWSCWGLLPPLHSVMNHI